MNHSITTATFATFTAKTQMAGAHGATESKSLECRVTFDKPTPALRFVVQAEGQEHFFDNLEQAITEYNKQ